jgi:hypothetical protein
LDDDEIVAVGSSVLLITRPFLLDRFLSNWKDCGLQLNNYEVGMFATDDAFDNFAREIFASNGDILIDPLFYLSDSEMRLINGTPMVSEAQLSRMAE